MLLDTNNHSSRKRQKIKLLVKKRSIKSTMQKCFLSEHQTTRGGKGNAPCTPHYNTLCSFVVPASLIPTAVVSHLPYVFNALEFVIIPSHVITESGTELFPLLSMSKICNKYALSGNWKVGGKVEPRLLSDVFLQELIGSGGSGEHTRFLERSPRTPMALEGWILVQASSSQLTPMSILSNQQPTGYSWSLSARNPPTFGAPSSAPVGGLVNTPSGAAYSPTGAGITATAAGFANAPIAPAPTPTGSSTTNPHCFYKLFLNVLLRRERAGVNLPAQAEFENLSA